VTFPISGISAFSTPVMSLNHEDIRRLAHLARIAVTDQEVAEISIKLNGVLAMIEELRAVDTTGVTPMAHGIDVVQRLREDRVTETNQRDLLQSIAPQVEGGLYLVPKVIE
jgi:aspartyl-tRNA(Asn)/glutamyl-tRNA(Gln) amidotransferase subunit C